MFTYILTFLNINVIRNVTDLRNGSRLPNRLSINYRRRRRDFLKSPPTGKYDFGPGSYDDGFDKYCKTCEFFSERLVFRFSLRNKRT